MHVLYIQIWKSLSRETDECLCNRDIKKSLKPALTAEELQANLSLFDLILLSLVLNRWSYEIHLSLFQLIFTSLYSTIPLF